MPEKILVVDDDEVFLRMTKSMLEKGGFEVSVATDGQQGLDSIERQLPSLILLDMLMPGMNGFTFCQKIKCEDKTKNIPVIILSARVQLEDSFKVLGVDDFLPKPLDYDLLQNKIRHHLKMAGSHKNRILKILAFCSQESVARRIREVLKDDRHCSFVIVSEPGEIFRRAFSDYPDIIFLDMMTGEIPADEIIRALRTISIFKQTVIYIFHPVSSEGSEDVAMSIKVLSLQELIQACLSAGADEDLGHFNEVVFRGCIQKYLTK